MRRAMNLLLRDAYIEDCERVLERWNRITEKAGVEKRFTLPSERFNRNQGVFMGMPFDPQGKMVSRAEWDQRRDTWLPSVEDCAYVQSLMVPVYEPGAYASWIAPPKKGINGKPVDFEYVKFVRAR